MPRSKKRTKTAKDKSLFELLSVDRYGHIGHDGQIDCDAIIEEVQRNPQSAAKQYLFEPFPFLDDRAYRCYPLLQAVKYCAPLSVIKAIYDSYPPAVKSKMVWTQDGIGDGEGQTALHLSLIDRSKAEVVSFLLDCWPDAIGKRNCSGELPLHVASEEDVPLEVILLLLEKHPEAIMEENDDGCTPVFLCEQEAFDSDPSLAVLKYVDQICGTKEIDRDAAEEILDYFLKIKWIRGVELLFDWCPSDTYDKDTYKKMMGRFIRMKWTAGAALIFDRCPSVAYELDIDTGAMPQFLSIIAQRCKMETMWNVVSNNLDMMEDN